MINMPKYSYKARSMQGGLVQGTIEADNLIVAKTKLSEQGLIPIVVNVTGGALQMNIKISKGVKAEELMLFTKQFGTLFRAGMGMESILGTLAIQCSSFNLKEALEIIKVDIQQGSSLAKAFGKHPFIFDDLYVNMLASGEEAGILEEVLDQLASVVEKDYAMKKGIKSAMLYPKIVIGVLVMAITALMYLVVPKFKSMFDSLGAELPLPTKILIGGCNFVRDYGLALLIGTVVVFVVYHKWSKTPKGRFLIDKFTFKLPIFGPLGLKVANARFANILACLYRSGLPVTKALSITAETIGNEAFMREVRVLQADVEKDHSIADSMRKLTYFTPIIVEATSIGEKTGSLDSMLNSMGEHYDVEISHITKNLSTMLEPILLVMIFGIVIVFALAIFLPMWGMHGAMLDKH